MDLLAPVGAAQLRQPDLDRIVTIVRREQLASFRLVEPCIDDVRLKNRLLEPLGTAATTASKRTASDILAGPPVTMVRQPAAFSRVPRLKGSSRCVRIRSIRVVNSTPPVWTSLPNRSVRRAFSNRRSSPRKE